jgi:hypothetical protein
MLNRLFDIREEDAEAVIDAKLQTGIGPLVDPPDAVVPFLAGLYAVSPTETLAASPEIYKSRLQKAFITLLSALARQGAHDCLHRGPALGGSILAGVDPVHLQRIGPSHSVCDQLSADPGFPDGERGGAFSYARESIRLTDLDPHHRPGKWYGR